MSMNTWVTVEHEDGTVEQITHDGPRAYEFLADELRGVNETLQGIESVCPMPLREQFNALRTQAIKVAANARKITADAERFHSIEKALTEARWRGEIA